MSLSSTALQNRVVPNLKLLWTIILTQDLNRNIIDWPWKVRSQKSNTAGRTVMFNKIIIRIKLIIIKRKIINIVKLMNNIIEKSTRIIKIFQIKTRTLIIHKVKI